MLNLLKNVVKSVSNVHRPDGQSDIFVFATPRGGSTWFMELICSQKGFRYCSEPLDMRSVLVRRYSGISSWEEMYDPECSEKFQAYFNKIISGEISFRNPNPFRPHHRFFTNRMVFKLIHGGVDRINWFRDEFNAKILLCLRHPVPVTLSRVEYPFLHRFLVSHYREQFTHEQLRFVKDIVRSGNKLQQGTVAWCIHNSVPLRNVESDWAVVTYEQSVVQPEPVIEYMCSKLELSEPDKIFEKLSLPSRSIVLSDRETQRMLERGKDDTERSALVKKWRNRVTDNELSAVQHVLDLFNIDVYRADQFLPAEKYWIGSDRKRVQASL